MNSSPPIYIFKYYIYYDYNDIWTDIAKSTIKLIVDRVV